MARAHPNWSLVAAADAPNAWLRQVMKNLIIDYFRHRDAEIRAIDRNASSSMAGFGRGFSPRTR